MSGTCSKSNVVASHINAIRVYMTEYLNWGHVVQMIFECSFLSEPGQMVVGYNHINNAVMACYLEACRIHDNIAFFIFRSGDERPEDRRVGKQCGRHCLSRRSQYR